MTQTRREDDMVTEGKIGVTWPKAKDAWGPRSWKRQEGPSPEASRGSMALLVTSISV